MSAFSRGGTTRFSEPKTIWLTVEVPGDIAVKVPELEEKLKEVAGKLANELVANRTGGAMPSIRSGHADTGKLKIFVQEF
jgi:hypothetical protein